MEVANNEVPKLEIKHQARILVVDDKSEIRGLLKRMLLRKYHYIDLANNGEDAFQHI